MSSEFVGKVEKITTRSVKTRRGDSTAYSAKIGDTWIGFGFESPPINEGDYVKVLAEKNDAGYWSFVKGSGSRVEAPKEEPKAKSAPASTSSGNGDARQMSIVMQHSQEMAITMTGLLLSHDALPISKASTKAGEAVRFREILAAVDKLTVKYYNDATSDRVLTTVADMGVVDIKPDTELPEPKKGASKPKKGAATDDLADVDDSDPSDDDGPAF